MAEVSYFLVDRFEVVPTFVDFLRFPIEFCSGWVRYWLRESDSLVHVVLMDVDKIAVDFSVCRCKAEAAFLIRDFEVLVGKQGVSNRAENFSVFASFGDDF